MKLLVLSDLHVEHMPFRPDAAQVAEAEVIVLAGDIHTATHAAAWARHTFGDRPIVMVAGNHEYFHLPWDGAIAQLRALALQSGVIFLEDDRAVINGVTFLGCTLWTDFGYFGADRRDIAMQAARRVVRDYRLIRGATPESTMERHAMSMAFLKSEMAQPRSGPRVVVTHHYPHRLSTAARFADDPVTAAFGSHVSASLIGGSDLWIHGHTHASCDYRLGGTRVVCNPRGYPRPTASGFENPDFDASLLVEV